MAKKMTKAEKQAWARKMQRAKAKKRAGKKKKRKSTTKKKRKSTKKRSTAKRKNPCPPRRKSKKRSTKKRSTKKRSTKRKSKLKKRPGSPHAWQREGRAPTAAEILAFQKIGSGVLRVTKKKAAKKKRKSKGKVLSLEQITGTKKKRGGLLVWGCIGKERRGCGGRARVIRPLR